MKAYLGPVAESSQVGMQVRHSPGFCPWIDFGSHGLYVTPANLPSEYTLLADGDLRDARPGASVAAAWEAHTGVRPVGETLADYLWSTMTHEDSPNQLMPTSAGNLELLLAGQVIRRRRFSLQRGPHAPLVLRKLRAKFTRLREEQGELRALKVVDADRKKYRLGPKAAMVWKLLLPQADRDSINSLPDAETTYSESFASSFGAFDVLTGSWGVSSGRAFISTTVSGNARYQLSLSSDDHFCEIVSGNIGSGSANRQQGPCCRMGPGDSYGYVAFAAQHVDALLLYRFESAGATFISNTAGFTPAIGQTYRLTCDGSTITALYVNGGLSVQVSDGTFTGRLRCGMHIGTTSAGQANCSIESWMCEDLPLDFVPGPYYYQLNLGG